MASYQSNPYEAHPTYYNQPQQSQQPDLQFYSSGPAASHSDYTFAAQPGLEGNVGAGSAAFGVQGQIQGALIQSIRGFSI